MLVICELKRSENVGRIWVFKMALFRVVKRLTWKKTFFLSLPIAEKHVNETTWQQTGAETESHSDCGPVEVCHVSSYISMRGGSQSKIQTKGSGSETKPQTVSRLVLNGEKLWKNNNKNHHEDNIKFIEILHLLSFNFGRQRIQVRILIVQQSILIHLFSKQFLLQGSWNNVQSL